MKKSTLITLVVGVIAFVLFASHTASATPPPTTEPPIQDWRDDPRAAPTDVVVELCTGTPPNCEPVQTLPVTGAAEIVAIVAVGFGVCCLGWALIQHAKYRRPNRTVDYNHHGGE
jgi:hypothetical protein